MELDKCTVESRTLLCLIGISFCVSLMVHLELPYNNLRLSFESSEPEPVDSGNTRVLKDGFSSNSGVIDSTPRLDDPHVQGSANASNLENESVATNVNVDHLPNRTVSVNESRTTTSKYNESLNDSSIAPSIDSTKAPEESEQSLSRKNVAMKPDETEQIFSQANVNLAPDETNLVPDSSSTMLVPDIVEPNNKKPARRVESNHTALHLDPSVTPVLKVKKPWKSKAPAVFSISEMNDLLLQSQSSWKRIRPRWSSPVDWELQHARSEILNAPVLQNDSLLYAPLYRNVSMFKRSYELMEAILKVYIYSEGEKPVFHEPTLNGIYASEGWFMKLLESNKRFATKNARKAHLFYLPFGSRNLKDKLYVPNSHNHANLIQYLKDYLDMIASKYPFWNRTKGADHFLTACHDWAADETKRHMANCIRALCNSDINEGFIFGKDVALPETYVLDSKNPLRNLGGLPPSQRSTLAFYAGNMHGYVRPILLHHWLNKDPDMKIFGQLPRSKGKMNYVHRMQSSKYCICPKGYEVNSPRVVEAIFYECVPVIISDNFVPPFFEILNWKSFAVFVLEKDIPNLKDILLSIPKERYLQMHMMVKKVQQHFLWHPRPEKFDLFHMILHSIWYSRVFQS